LELGSVGVRLVERREEGRFRALMQAHHYLGALPKISETLWYVASYEGEWIALLSFSAAAWKCAARDQWIGWDFRHRYDRLKLIANNSRFVILPEWHRRNLGSKVLSLCERRLASDWQVLFGHPLVLVETFVDPTRFRGTVYRAANWTYVGESRGFQRIRGGYRTAGSAKKVFLKALQADARAVLSRPVLDPAYRIGVPKIMLSAEQMRTLPDFFAAVRDPRRSNGRRHPLPAVLSLAAAATLCGMRGYKGFAEWAESLSQKVRARFRCRRVAGRYVVPSEFVIRDVLIRIDPDEVDRALQRWNEVYGQEDSCLALDGKTMCNAIDEAGRQTHVMSVVGHNSKICYTQKKSVPCR
jgi:GNAT superfamily N-acetyltransferase